MEPLEQRHLLTGYIGVVGHEVPEGSQNAVLFELSLQRDPNVEPPHGEVTVYFTIGSNDPDEATIDTDYSFVSASGFVVFTSNSDDASVYVNVATDQVWDPNEKVTLHITGYQSTVGAEYSYSADPVLATLLDTNGPHIAITASGSTLNESSGNSITFTVTREAPALGELLVDLLIDPSSTVENDYSFSPENSLEINFAENQLTYQFTVTALRDCVYEQNETLTIKVQPSQYYLTGEPSSATVTIVDEDLPPRLYLGDWTGTEQGTAVFGVTAKCARDESQPGLSELPVSVSFQTANGTALAGSDFTSTSGTWPTEGIVVPITADSIDEDNETFSVNLSGAANATVADGQGLGTILDNDNPPEIRISDVSVKEDAGTAALTVSLCFASQEQCVLQPSGKMITVDYSTTDGTAKAQGPGVAEQDYAAVASTSLNFSPGETTKTVTVSIKQDKVYEAPGTEYFRVNLSNLSSTVWVGDLQGTVTIVDDERPPKQIPRSCESCSSTQPGAGRLIGNNAAGVSSSFGDPGWSEHPVRYADGAVLVASTDLLSEGFGLPWGISRTWSNAPGYRSNNIMGHGMVVAQQPYLIGIDGTDTIAVITNGHTTTYFDRIGTSNDYAARFFLQERFSYDPVADEYVLTDTSGAQIRFFHLRSSLPYGQQGQFKSYADAAGNAISATSYTASGQLEELQRSFTQGGTAFTESFFYTYVTTGENAGLVASVTLRRREGTGAWTTVRMAEYDYYLDSDAFGNTGDLRTVRIEDGANNLIDTTYYRYYEPGEPNGYVHGLKFVFYPTSFERMAAELAVDPVTSPTATNTAVAPYADHYFEYDSEQRATKEIAQGAGCSTCSGGLGSFAYQYTVSNNAPGPNSWAVKTVETLPDGNQNVVYTNADGQVMLKVFIEAPGTTNEKQWATFYEYDSSGRVLLRAEPSAVSGYNETYADLLNKISGNYANLRDSVGLVTTFTYYSTTTATSTTPGGAAGYLQQVSIRQGETGADIPQSSQQYVSRTAYNTTVYLPATSTVYVNANGTGALTTEYQYTFASASLRPESLTTTDPAGGQSIVYFDDFGRPVWSKDAEGYLHYGGLKSQSQFRAEVSL